MKRRIPSNYLRLGLLAAILCPLAWIPKLFAQSSGLNEFEGVTFLGTQKELYAVMPNTLVTSTVPEAMEWSPDGRYLLLVERLRGMENVPTIDDLLGEILDPSAIPVTRIQIQIWDSVSGRADLVWHADSPAVTVSSITRMGRAGKFIVALYESPSKDAQKGLGAAMVVDGKIKSAKFVSGFDGVAGRIEASGSTKSEIGVLWREEAVPNPNLAPPNDNGYHLPQVIAQFNGQARIVAQAAVNSVAGVQWEEGTDKWFFEAVPLGTSEFSTFQMNENGSLVKLVTKPVALTPPASGAVDFTPIENVIPIGDKKLKVTTWIARATVQGHASWHAIATGVDRACISKDQHKIAFAQNGCVQYVRVVRVADTMANAIIERARRRAMLQAKMIGTALFMYASDADDRLPLSDVSETLKPYLGLGNSSMLNNFTYQAAPGSKAGVDAVMGYIEGPGGRAIVYGDGTVKWQPNT